MSESVIPVPLRKGDAHPSSFGTSSMSSLGAFIGARRPLLFVGHGARLADARDLILRVAEFHQIPVLATSHLKGYLPETHPLIHGVFGFASRPETEEWLKAYAPDAVFFMGTRLGEASTLGWSRALSAIPFKIQVLDSEPYRVKKIDIDHFIRGDLSESLRFLLNSDRAAFADERATNFAPSLNSERARKKLATSLSIEQLERSPIHPVDLIRALEISLPENSLLVSDIGNSMAWCVNELVLSEKQEFYFPLGLGAMGSGIGVAIGAKLADPQRPVVCITGDCAMLMHGQEIVTALQMGASPTFIVLNDGGHGMVDHGHRLNKLGGVRVRFKQNIDFGQWSAAMGAVGVSIRTLKDLIELDWDALANSSRPVVLDLAIDATVVPPIQSRTKVIGQSLGLDEEKGA